jgi:glycosyltransferase involved in cell wall biosynthesis
MRVAIDYNAALRQLAGIGRYSRELVRALAELRSGDDIILFYAARDLHPGALDGLRRLQALNPRVKAAPIPITERLLTIVWQRLRLPLPVERWTGPVDVVHAPDFVLPPARASGTIVTVHDLSFRLHPEAAHERLRRYLESAVPRSLRRAARVLADSASTADDLRRLMSVPPDKISVLYPGVGAQFRRVADAAQLASVGEKYALPPRFFMHVGTIEPRKNLERLMAAYRAVREERGEDAGGLVLAGKPGWLSDPILAAARSTPGVMLTGPVADEDLPALYSAATALVYPTLYEGFGFPPLEALACGAPVITSNTSSLPEIVAGIGLMVDPLDRQVLAAALRRVLDDPAITEQARNEGPSVAARFAWPRAAQQLLDVYREMSGLGMGRVSGSRG